MTRLWLVRLGKNGEYEQQALEDGLLRIGFGVQQDIEGLNRENLLALMEKLHPDAKPAKRRNFASQINQFVNIAADGDLIVCPMKTSSTVAIGRFAGPYRPGPDGGILRPVSWFPTNLSRDVFGQDLRYSLGAIMTVCQISRNDAVRRVKRLIETGFDPGDGSDPTESSQQGAAEVAPENGIEAPVNLYDLARDQIEERIASQFSGHDFTRLVAAVLEAQGYRTRVSPPGKDRGVDIVAGSGRLGLESPRVTVQVKSGSQVVDQPVLQALIGSVQDTQADYGLVVSWGGFTRDVESRRNELFFRVRLWGRQEFVDNLLTVYNDLPEDIRADLPLKRIWTLVPDDETSG